ncbi:Major Facilitator Superfamily with SPX (SYG1/Pho81/XPR1) domain-containing protein [Hibiscus syriacus]|uniref:Major Facilitator Superfamily with SPX (SYG1/Pho81/XPR1) domain-containing protein n=1 Tax=Hibiscus syriacus TaxID=106335 RepID=A0A6A3BZL5_HIBSY|nr:uncharacterized protein LOC120207146 [Hibiscus syriacus]KAE8722163.1 Major Facilitator Superfamily with SPX (SYG1/Pho81/XPR1) domain-containing protein [Hibiscus syriacus]
MASCDHCRRRRIRALIALAEEASCCWCCVLALVTLLLLLNCFNEACTITNGGDDEDIHVKGMSSVPLLDRACDEIYVVGEGETLNSIIDKCGDPSIVDHNPHIHDPDDVFPGFVIKVKPRKSLN